MDNNKITEIAMKNLATKIANLELENAQLRAIIETKESDENGGNSGK